MAVNLSDIAAMGGTPRWALVALAVPPQAEVEAVDGFYAGMEAAAAPHAVAIVGGDTSASPAGWFANVTLLGEHSGTPRLRSMAQPGDTVAVTGMLGRSAAGLHALDAGLARAREAGLDGNALEEVTRAHLRPTARVAEGRWLGAQPAVHAMIDCSDGLATDLDHVCRESGVGARVQVERLPVAPAAQAAARALGGDGLRWASAGGEDYELVVTCEREAFGSLADGLRRATGTALTAIGQIEASGTGIVWVDARGRRLAMGAGFEHFSGQR
jgi:thiamine-monophosphate kinase